MGEIFRKATIEDLDGVEIIYKNIHSMEEEGEITTGWKRDIYPVRKTADAAVVRGDLYVCELDGRVVASAILNNIQGKDYL